MSEDKGRFLLLQNEEEINLLLEGLSVLNKKDVLARKLEDRLKIARQYFKRTRDHGSLRDVARRRNAKRK